LDETAAEKNRRKRALEVLLEARERLLSQVTDDILSHSDALLDGSQEGVFSFEFQEIEDRYSARLNALNSLLEHLECREPIIENRVETVETSRRSIKKDLAALVRRLDQWDLVDFEVVPQDESLLLIAVFTRDEYPD
jgi:hypothetical protein